METSIIADRLFRGANGLIVKVGFRCRRDDGLLKLLIFNHAFLQLITAEIRYPFGILFHEEVSVEPVR